jgi:hypothetical protein
MIIGTVTYKLIDLAGPEIKPSISLSVVVDISLRVASLINRSRRHIDLHG